MVVDLHILDLLPPLVLLYHLVFVHLFELVIDDVVSEAAEFMLDHLDRRDESVALVIEDGLSMLL